MNLLTEYENTVSKREEIKKNKKELNIKEGIGELVSSIISGKEYFYTRDKEIFEELKVKYKRDDYSYSSLFCPKSYCCKITKTLIKKVEKYLEESNNDKCIR